jgi:hypothetical protein
MDTRKRAKTFRGYIFLTGIFALMGLLGLMPFLPKMFPDSKTLQVLFGSGKFAIFWVIVIIIILILVEKEKPKPPS